MFVGARSAGLSISVTADLFTHSCLRDYTELCNEEQTWSEQQLCGQKCLDD